MLLARDWARRRPIGCVCDGDTRAECTAPTITLGRARCVTHRRSDEPAEELLPQSTCSTWPVKPTYRDTSGQRCVIVCEVAAGRPRLHRPGDGASESCIRQATTTSQIIHARSRTQASTMAIDCVREKPSEPTTQPCTR